MRAGRKFKVISRQDLEYVFWPLEQIEQVRAFLEKLEYDHTLDCYIIWQDTPTETMAILMGFELRDWA
jgi:hypothetical protein